MKAFVASLLILGGIATATTADDKAVETKVVHKRERTVTKTDEKAARVHRAIFVPVVRLKRACLICR